MSLENTIPGQDFRQSCIKSRPKRRRPRWLGRIGGVIRRHKLVCVFLGVVTVLGLAGTFYEAHTSAIQARLFAAVASRLSFRLLPGRTAATAIAFPAVGPFNQIRGYSRLPDFLQQLAEAGFHIAEQAHVSPELAALIRWGITPPYSEPAVAGLLIRDESGKMLYDATTRQRVSRNYQEISPLVIEALLLVENRELADSSVATRNPVIDWQRSAKAGFLYAVYKLGLPVRIEGGSTLATQLEKFRYAENGRTSSLSDKLRQMLSASLRAYRFGPDTTAERRQIVLDYLNSVPLSAAPGYGEVYGLGNGLFAWFGMELNEAMSAMRGPAVTKEKEQTFKHILALICATRAPSYYLKEDRPALEARIDFYTRALENEGAISADFARGVRAAPLRFLDRAPVPDRGSFLERKAVNAVRGRIMDQLGVHDLYSLDRLQLAADSTLDAGLQAQVSDLFEELKDPEFISSHGLNGEQLLSRGDPTRIIYSFTLFERTPLGNVLRVQADSLDQPFDLNEGMKLELGSTAKLRTLAHYLELVASLYHEFRASDGASLAESAGAKDDPITQWVHGILEARPGTDLRTLLDLSLERRYSGDSQEVFFTGGGAHKFSNFDKAEDGASFTVRDGLIHSVNLVYIRLMQDLVRFHEARLPYDPAAVLSDPSNPDRARLLEEIAAKESQENLYRAYKAYRNLPATEILTHLLGTQSGSASRLAMVFLAGHSDADAAGLRAWLLRHGISASEDEASRLLKAYDPQRLDISDYGYLLDRHPLEVWCATQLLDEPSLSWEQLLARSKEARQAASRWLFRTRNIRAQDLRLKSRFEQDAFLRMTPYWQRLSFPFDELVPSLATAIGSSADRPAALAELMGIILNDGVRLPVVEVQRLRFAAGTPYETVVEPNPPAGQRVMEFDVAHVLRAVLEDVVKKGTATRLAGVFKNQQGKDIIVGGKTGSGDNRFKTFDSDGHLQSSRAISRTGTFAFFLDDRYFGVLTAHVQGETASTYGFTSALPVATLGILAPSIEEVVHRDQENFTSATSQQPAN